MERSAIEYARRLVDPAAVRSRGYLDAKLRVDLGELRPDMADFARAFIRELERRQYPFFVAEGLRSRERQAELKAAGFSRAGPGQSPHQFGAAVDIVHLSRGWNLARDEWDIVGLIGLEVARKRNLKVTWGGNFKSIYDPAHWELTGWLKVPV